MAVDTETRDEAEARRRRMARARGYVVLIAPDRTPKPQPESNPT